MIAPHTPPAGTGHSTITEILTDAKQEIPRKAGRPKDPNAKQVRQIALRPGDWEYLALFPVVSHNVPDNDSTRMERLIERTRASAPHGPDKPFYTPDPDAPQKERTTPAIARYAKLHGLSKAEVVNMAWKALQATLEAKEIE